MAATFAVDTTTYLNEFNRKLQGEGSSYVALFCNVGAFEVTLILLHKHISEKKN
jgi:hypothetical protein